MTSQLDTVESRSARLVNTVYLLDCTTTNVDPFPLEHPKTRSWTSWEAQADPQRAKTHTFQVNSFPFLCDIAVELQLTSLKRCRIHLETEHRRTPCRCSKWKVSPCFVQCITGTYPNNLLVFHKEWFGFNSSYEEASEWRPHGQLCWNSRAHKEGA